MKYENPYEAEYMPLRYVGQKDEIYRIKDKNKFDKNDYCLYCKSSCFYLKCFNKTRLKENKNGHRFIYGMA